MSLDPVIGILAMTSTARLEAAGQVLIINALSLLLLLTIIWTVLRLTMPGEEKIITDAFRRRKA